MRGRRFARADAELGKRSAPRPAHRFTWGALALAGVLACTTYGDHLSRGQRAYQQNEFEQALAIWRVLERNMASLTPEEQTRYAYLRGMTAYRLGFRADARHWLAISKALDEIHPGSLSGEWRQRVNETIAELNRDVFGERMAADAAAAASAQGASPAPPGAESTGAGAGLPAGAGSPAGAGPRPAVEGFDPPPCASDADCKIEESCVQGGCQTPEQ